MKRRRPEQALQIQVAAFLRVALRPPTLWTAFPAGGGGKVRGAFLKAMGLQAGWPDIVIIHRFESLTETLVLGIELKAGKGRQSPEQKAVMESFISIGAGYEICRSIEDVDLALVHHGIPLHASVGGSVKAPPSTERGEATPTTTTREAA